MKIINVANPFTDLVEFNNSVPKHKATVLVYTMKGCPHCDMLSPKWEVVKKILNKEPAFKNVMSADIDSGVSNMLPLPPVMGFPMIKVLKDKKLHRFDGVREVDPILKFLREKVIDDEIKVEPLLKTITTPRPTPNIELDIIDVAGNKRATKKRHTKKRHTKKRNTKKRNTKKRHTKKGRNKTRHIKKH